MGVWIETRKRVNAAVCKGGHTLYGCVDWNLIKNVLTALNSCHTLYGCVDWNGNLERIARLRDVTPCMGVWIETLVGGIFKYTPNVTPCMGVWIETSEYISIPIGSPVTPCMGVWIETNQYF